MTPPLGFSTPPQIPNNTASERPPVITTVFSATTPENTLFAYRASTSANLNMIISPVFVEENYEDYDEEREMEQRPEPNREATPSLRPRSPVVHRQRERVVGFEEAPNREGSMGGRNAEGLVNGQPLNFPLQTQIGNPPAGGISTYHPQGGIYHRLSPTMAYLHTMDLCTFADSTGSVTSFVRWSEDYPLPDGLKMPSYIGSYDGKRDPDNFLHLFKGAIRMQKWLMPVACHMFTYTLKDSARIWWNGQNTGSILNYEDLKAKSCSHFSQQKKFTKTHLVVHNIKQREGKSTRTFVTRYTDDTL
ncbi:hypothetical protein Tco_1056847 [Tanacetum coccineum]|uniref:Reverse transcriptase domain-containing protein n=1 Tax=Tanacetum coccineum TaxID=301880 RepID=A0ABQ5H3P8_9ASTR